MTNLKKFPKLYNKSCFFASPIPLFCLTYNYFAFLFASSLKKLPKRSYNHSPLPSVPGAGLERALQVVPAPTPQPPIPAADPPHPSAEPCQQPSLPAGDPLPPPQLLGCCQENQRRYHSNFTREV